VNSCSLRSYLAAAFRFYDLGNRPKEIGLEINADKTKYMVMSRDQN